MINARANTPAKDAERFAREALALAVLAPGDVYEVEALRDNSPAVKRFANI